MDYNVALTANASKVVKTGYTIKTGDKGQKLIISVTGIDMEGTTAKIVFLRANNTAVESGDIIQREGRFEYVLKGNELIVAGRVIVDVKFYETNRRESTASFIFEAISDTLDSLAGEAAPYSDTLEHLSGEMQNAIDSYKGGVDAIERRIVESAEAVTKLEEDIANALDTAEQNFDRITAEKTEIINTYVDNAEAAANAASDSAVEANGSAERAEAAAESIRTSREQIDSNTADIALLKENDSQLSESIAEIHKPYFEDDGTGENKCNPYKMTNGKLNHDTGEVDASDATCSTSDYIEIQNGMTKVVASKSNNSNISYQRIAFYKADKSFVSCTYSGTSAVDIPVDAKYVRVSNGISGTAYVGFNNTGIYNGFVAYAIGKIHEDRLPDDLATQGELEIIKEFVNSKFPVSPDGTNFFIIEISSNLFEGTTDDFVIGRLKDGVVDESQTGFLTSPMIKLGDDVSGKYVIIKTSGTEKGSNARAFYDINENFITGYNYSDSTGVVLIPENAYYVRFSGTTNRTRKYFVAINTEPSIDIPYEPYYRNVFLKEEYIDVEKLNKSWYKGKKATALGDSITANGSTYYTADNREGSAWREFVAQELGLSETVYNCGVGGSKVSGNVSSNPSMWTDSRINAIPEDTEILFFNGGMNDWGGNVQLGDEDGTDTNTFYGALNVIAEKLVTKFPTIPIFFMSTTYGYKGDRPDGKNTIGLTQYDYGRAIIKVAQKWGFIPIDLHSLCGWNKVNVSTYVNDESTTEFAGFIHPNRNGGRKITTAICSIVKSYQPCEIE